MADQPDLLRRRRVGDVDDLEAALGRARQPEVTLVVAAAGRIGCIDQELGVGGVRERVLGVQDRPALRRRLDVVLEPGYVDGVGEAAGRRVAAEELGVDDAALGQPDDRLAAGVGAGPERADRGKRVPALGEEVDVGVGVAGRDRRHELPLRVRAA
jgi:hypothetical protein